MMMTRLAARLPVFVLALASCMPAASPRFARLGAFEGSVEVQLEPADTWRPAIRNLPLPESARIRTGPDARVEIELDDASVFRMAGEGLAELTDYIRLSGGQRITVISLDRGLAYFTGEPGDANSVHLLVPGAQAGVRQGSRIRLQAMDDWSEIAIIEGFANFTIPTAQMDLRDGQSARVAVPSSTHFSLYREIAPLEFDAWSEALDRDEEQDPASRLDLDRAGKWIATSEYGTVWQPAAQAGWAPFRQGKWMWFQPVGYTWVGAEPWGWKPYHEGRWLQHSDLGWVWVPGVQAAPFSPGEVYWARSANAVAWGPLAPGEQWAGAGPARQFAALNTTAGSFVIGAREILPSPVELPKDLLKTFLFTAALASPPLPVSRLVTAAQPLRTRLFSAVEVVPAIPAVTQSARPREDVALASAAVPPSVQDVFQPERDPAVPNGPAGLVVPGVVVVNGRDRATVSAKQVTLRMAGSADGAQLYERWFQTYNAARIIYDTASDSTNPASSSRSLYFPTAITAVIPIYNPELTLSPDGLKLTPEILAGIFLGEIKRWDDPKIVAANSGQRLLQSEIVVIGRSDGCTATTILANYLAKVSERWRSHVPPAPLVQWPSTFVTARGNEQVAEWVRRTPNAIGYVDLAFLKGEPSKSALGAAWVRNRAGRFAQATPDALSAAASSEDLGPDITDARADTAYPIASYTWLKIPQRSGDSARVAAARDFLNWMLSTGQKDVAAFQLTPLPESVVARERNRVGMIY